MLTWEGVEAKANPSQLVSQQSKIQLKGTVTDTKGAPVVGASVVQKGTLNGTSTDENGVFTLTNLKSGVTLEISCLGYSTKEVVYNGESSLTFILEEDENFLTETVIVGYGTQKKINVTGAVSSVDSKTLEARPVANISQALQGTIPGLNLSTSNQGGALGSGMSFNIRGTGSIGAGSSDAPLLLIDGIEGNINLLNPQDVESITVLKDAASSSIYGARAAFGVILIKTKSGSSGKVKVNFSSDVRFSTATQLPKMVDSYTFATYFNEAARNGGGQPTFNDEMLQLIQDYQAGKFTDPNTPEYYGTRLNKEGTYWTSYTGSFANTNWFDEFYMKNAPSTQQNLSISGGTEKFNWLISGSYLYQRGLIRHGKDMVNRYNFNVKLGAKLTDWARIDYSMRYVNKSYTRPAYMDDGSGIFFHNIARRWPTLPIKAPNGYYFRGNEITELEEGGTGNTLTMEYVQQLNFTLTPLKGWNIHADFGMKNSSDQVKFNRYPIVDHWANGTTSLRGGDWGISRSKIDESNWFYNYYSINIYSDYNFSIGKNNFTALVGLNAEKYDQNNLWGSGLDLVTNSVPYLSATQSDPKTGDSFWHRGTAGYFGRLNYNYDERYLLEGNLRYDGSSRFLSNKRWGLFPSISAGWNISKEEFWTSIKPYVNNLKIRASWGSLGNTSSRYEGFYDWYPFYQLQTVNKKTGNWLINGTKPNTASLPGIVSDLMTWETIKTINGGLDFGFFDNKVSGSLDVYRRDTKNMIGPAPELPSVLGADAPRINNCDMKTYGWELEIEYKDTFGEVDFNSKFNLSDARSFIVRYPNEAGIISNYYNGKELGEIWGYKVQGLANSNEEMAQWLENNKPAFGNDWGEGDVMYKDLNGDKIVNGGSNTLDDHGDLVRIGNTTPRYRFGITLGAAWKGIDFSIFLQGVAKRDWMPGSGDLYFWNVDNMWQSPVYVEHLNRWTPDNHNGYYPKATFKGASRNRQASDRYLQSSAYLRIKNVQLGYSLPASILNKTGISSCRLYVSCDNLYTFTKLASMFDPEAFDAYGWYGGAGKTYPLQRVVSFGVNLNF